MTRLYRIGDTKLEFGHNVHLVPKNGKSFTFYTKNEFLPKNLTRLYKLGIKTGVWYPKMYIWSLKMEKFVLFTLKMKFLPKQFDPIVQIGDKKLEFGTPKCTFGP